MVDCWSDDNVLQIRFKNAYVAPFCDKYGGAHNSVDIKGDGTGLYGVYISGYGPNAIGRSQSGSYNHHVTADITGIGSLRERAARSGRLPGRADRRRRQSPGWRGTDLHDNVIEGSFVGTVPPVMRAVIANATGAGRNIFKVQGGNFTESFAKHTPDAASTPYWRPEAQERCDMFDLARFLPVSRMRHCCGRPGGWRGRAANAPRWRSWWQQACHPIVPAPTGAGSEQCPGLSHPDRESRCWRRYWHEG